MLDKSTDRDERVTNIRRELPTGPLMAGANWWSIMVECDQEVGQFISDRLEKDAEAIRQMLRCRDWAEAVRIQARWVNETVRDYNDEMKKLARLYAKSAAAAVRGEGDLLRLQRTA